MNSPKAYIIGGSARCGKSTLARELRKIVDAQYISTDSIKHALHLQGYSFGSANINHMTSSIGQWVRDIRERDLAITQFLVPLIEDVVNVQGDNIIIDNGFWANDISRLDTVQSRVVFMVDTADDHAMLLRAIRDSGTDGINNWHHQRKHDDDWIDSWASYNIARSRMHKELAEQYQLACFDLKYYSGLDAMQDAALGHLLS